MTVSELRTLVDNLDEYIHIPGGIDRLKKMVLHLAVSGQLVPQHASEGTGEELYQQIQAERLELIKQGKIKKQKAVPEIDKNETPFMIPSSWRWVRLGDVTNYGSSEKAKPSSIGATTWILELEDIEKTSSTLLAEVNGDERSPSSDKNIFYKDDVLYGKLRPYLDKVIVAHRNGVCSSEILPLRSPGYHVDPNYLRFALKSPYFLDYVNELTYGVKMPRLGTDDGRNALIGLAPHSEQKRIVEKVNNIFALTDRLAEAYKSEQAERSKLVASSLVQLAKAGNDVEDSLALTHLSEIIRTKADAKILRQTILHLAVSGQLVPQDPSEGTGEELYRQIQAEKLDLIKQGKIKKQKTLSKISEDEVPFVIPENWKWVRFPEIYNSITPVTKLKTTDYLDSGKYPIIDQGQRYIAGYTNNGELNIVTTPVTIFGDHTREIKLIDFDFIVGADGVKILEPMLVNSSFFYTLVDVFRPQSRGYGRHFKMLNDKIVPLPPLDEQKRIVAKTTQLLDLVSELEKYLEK